MKRDQASIDYLDSYKKRLTIFRWDIVPNDISNQALKELNFYTTKIDFPNEYLLELHVRALYVKDKLYTDLVEKAFRDQQKSKPINLSVVLRTPDDVAVKTLNYENLTLTSVRPAVLDGSSDGSLSMIFSFLTQEHLKYRQTLELITQVPWTSSMFSLPMDLNKFSDEKKETNKQQQ